MLSVRRRGSSHALLVPFFHLADDLLGTTKGRLVMRHRLRGEDIPIAVPTRAWGRGEGYPPR